MKLWKKEFNFQYLDLGDNLRRQIRSFLHVLIPAFLFTSSVADSKKGWYES